ncbi:MAG: SUMF1/EgtB/PvdO family nonheme iron enzyme [Planctomycetes bacterium]|nr:SUMF1/EgtB/PvdO family nonheme iron enzyme [Planctomycetota bacterium]
MTAELISSSGARLIQVTPGSFIMGSPQSEPGHMYWEGKREVTLSHEFYLGATPVTKRQYERVTGENPTDHAGAGKDAPVDSVNWDMANAFCSKLTEIDGQAGVLRDGWEYRLPTEAEWEYACRAGNQEARYGAPDSIAWYLDNAEGRPHTVAQKAPNDWGFHDMLGNVCEWCQDLFWRANPCRAVRGGSYYNTTAACRAARREGWGPGNRGRYCGFRVLAAQVGPFELTPPLDDFTAPPQQPSIFDAFEAGDYALAENILAEKPEALEGLDGIPPSLHMCIYADQPEWFEWLLDHGADIERREQDYGAAPLRTAIVMRRKTIIQILVDRGVDTAGAMDIAARGLAGAFEDDPSLDREGYAEIVELLRKPGVK